MLLNNSGAGIVYVLLRFISINLVQQQIWGQNLHPGLILLQSNIHCLYQEVQAITVNIPPPCWVIIFITYYNVGYGI